MEWLRSPSTWLLILGLAVAVVLVLRKSLGSRSFGFKDLLKNPGLWDLITRRRREVEDEIEAAERWSGNRIRQATRHFVFDVETSHDAWDEMQVLSSLESRLHPALLEILRDAALRTQLSVPTGTHWEIPEAPVDRVCLLLGDEVPEEFIDLLRPFATNPSPEIRQAVVGVLANVKSVGIVGLLRQAVSDTNEYVRMSALVGLRDLARDGYLDEQCRQELIGETQEFLIRGEDADSATALFFALDRNAATEFFLSSTMFTAASPSLHEGLEVLTEQKVLIPRERLFKLIEALEGAKLEYPRTYALASALRLLGLHQEPEDRAFLETWASHAEAKIAEGAAAGLIAFHGLEEFKQRLWDGEKEEGRSALSVPQQHFIAVSRLDSEVNNGGHAQYFANSNGESWRLALAGLAAMGFQERLAIFREAVAKFGTDGPSENREARQDQLARLARSNGALFDALDDRFYKCPEVVDVFATRYVIGNAEAFK